MRDFLNILIRTLFSKDQPPLTHGEQQAILKFRGLGIYDATQHLDNAATLAASGATTRQVQQFARISAQGAIFPDDLNALQNTGIHIVTKECK